MKIKFLLFGLLIIFLFSCDKTTKKKVPSIFPKIINKYNKTSEEIEKNSKKLSLYQKYNENDKMVELVHSTYTNNLEIYRYKYKNSLYAYSEFTIAKDNSYEPFLKSNFAYQVNDKVVLLSENYIYVINLKLCNLNKLKLTPKSSVKIPKSDINLISNTERLFINNDNSFPFFKSYIKREGQYKDIIVSTIESIKKSNKEIKDLENFIKKQKTIKETNQYIIFKTKENNSLFLYDKSKKILFLNITEDDLGKLVTIEHN